MFNFVVQDSCFFFFLRVEFFLFFFFLKVVLNTNYSNRFIWPIDEIIINSTTITLVQSGPGSNGLLSRSPELEPHHPLQFYHSLGDYNLEGGEENLCRGSSQCILSLIDSFAVWGARLSVFWYPEPTGWDVELCQYVFLLGIFFFFFFFYLFAPWYNSPTILDHL